MSNLVLHAERELKRAGLFDADSDYGGMLGNAVLRLVKMFAEEGHSGFSAGMAIQLFEKLARFQPLTPITSDPEEWMVITDGMAGKLAPLWQNTRKSSSFSHDAGKTWYDLDDEEETKRGGGKRIESAP